MIHNIIQTTLSPDHIVAELVWSFVLDLTLLPVLRRAVRRHDREVHDTRN